MLRNVCDLILVAVTTLTQTATQLYASNISFPINDMTPTPPQTDTSLQTLLNSTVINSTSPNLNTFQYLPHSPIWQNETFRFFFNPPAINDLLVDSNRTVNFNCSSNNNLRYVNDTGNLYRTKDSLESSNTSVFVLIQARDSRVAKLIDVNADNDVEKKKRTNSGDYLPSSTETLVKPIIPNTENNFTVLAMHIGYATMSVTLIDANSLEMAKNGIYRALSQADYQITVKRAEKLADFVFNCSAAAVAILISFGIGCVTDTESLKKQLKYPMSLVVGFCCQFLILPVLAFGIAKMLPLDNDVRFGLLCVACVPGGGLGHVAVILGQADIPLSLAMNLISIVAMLGTAPLWIFVLGQHFYNHHGYKIIPIYNFEIWLASTFFAYTAGLVINRFKPNVADALLTWIIKPLMLLAAILYITLGVYINMYVFEVINEYAVLAAFLLPLCGFTVAFVIGKIFRQKDDFCKSMALETSSLNVLIVIAAIRFSLTKTSADLASVVPLWVMFTIPAIYVLLIILNFLKGCVMNFLESRKQQQFRHFSIASGIVNQANIAALSAPLFVTEITDDDQGSISEKITVL